MTIQPCSSCPDWCDPRAHIQRDPESPEHRSAGLTWKPNAADTQLTVCTVRLDETGTFTAVGATFVNLSIRDVESVYPGGREIAAETDLDPADARMLAAALVCEAERVEALLRRRVVTR